MTVENQENKITKNANGVQTYFEFGFRILNRPNLVVRLILEDETEVTQQEGVDYYILDGNNSESGSDFSNGGSVTFYTAPAATEKVFMLRNIPMNQDIDLRPGAGFPEPVINDGFDKGILIAQDLQERIDRCLKIEDYVQGTEVVLPAASPGKALMWDPLSNKLINSTDNFNDIVADANSAADRATEQFQGAQSSAEAAAASQGASEASAAKAQELVDVILPKVEEAERAQEEARIWTEGTDAEVAELGGEHSAKGWAENAAFGQIQTDWDQEDTSAPSFIKNKPTKLSDFENDLPPAPTTSQPFTVNEASKDYQGNPNFVSTDGTNINFNGGITYTTARGEVKTYSSVASIPLSNGQVVINDGIASVIPAVFIQENEPDFSYSMPLQTSNTNPVVLSFGSENTSNLYAFHAFDGNPNTEWFGNFNSSSNYIKKPLGQTILCDGVKITEQSTTLGGTKTIQWYKDSSKTQLLDSTILAWDKDITKEIIFNQTNTSISELYFNFPDGHGSSNKYTPTIIEIELINARTKNIDTNSIWYNPKTGIAQIMTETGWQIYNGAPVAQIVDGVVYNYQYNAWLDLDTRVAVYSQKTKEIIARWGFPDYSRGVSVGVPTDDYEVEFDCEYVAFVGNERRTSYLLVNGAKAAYCANGAGNADNFSVTVKLQKGDKFKWSSEPYYTKEGYLFPLKGEN